MPGLEVDLTGQKFGWLTVVRLVGKVQHGRNMVKMWSCVCGCGNELEVDQASLKKGQVPACKTCRRGPCVVCFEPITNESYSVKRNTCSDECHHEKIKEKSRRRYYKLIELDPEHNKKRHRQRVLADPDYNKKRYQRRMEKFKKLPEKIQQKIIKKQNEYSRAWKSDYIKHLKKTDPEGYRVYRARRNYYFRNWYKQMKQKIKNSQ